MNSPPDWVPFVPLLGGVLAMACLFFALRSGRRFLLVKNLPTSKTTGVFIGLVELKGTAESAQPLVSFLAEGACVHYAWNVSEKELQTELAELRAQMAATPPGIAGPDFHAVRPTLLAIAERYPELKAQASFLNLQKNLVDTEERIALARGYFNEIATHYNTRLEIIPDRFIAALGGLRPQALMQADEFERAPVEVDFATAQTQPLAAGETPA